MIIMSRIMLTVLFVFIALVVNIFAEAPRGKDSRLWSDSEFERGKEATKDLLKIGPPLLEKQVTLYTQPPFYKGNLPLIYSVRQWGYPGMHITFVIDFGEWRNDFIYLELGKKNYALADGARASEPPSGRVLAEAKLIDPFLGTTKPLLIEECHLGKDGKVIFRCKSYFNKDNGFKESETAISGNKLRDYFLIWPMGR